MPCAGPGISYRDEIAQEFPTGMKFWSLMTNRAWCPQPGCPLCIRGHRCPQALCRDSGGKAPSILTRPPWSWSCVCHCHLLVSPGRGTRPHIGGRAGGIRDRAWKPWKRGCGAGAPVGGGHVFGRVHRDDLQPFLGGSSRVGMVARGLSGILGRWRIWGVWRVPGTLDDPQGLEHPVGELEDPGRLRDPRGFWTVLGGFERSLGVWKIQVGFG